MQEENVSFSRNKNFKSLCNYAPKMAKALQCKAFGFLKVARAGFEPTYTEPKSVVLPLDDRAIRGVQIYNLRFYFQKKSIECI
jgi:hypothetical protein